MNWHQELLQDDSRELSRWFASRIDARRCVRDRVKEIEMIWILEICTAGWVLCGQQREIPYPDEPSCYRALEQLYKQQGREAFKYVLCVQRKGPTP